MDNATDCPRSRHLGVRPEEILPALPLLLGYPPVDSLVCLFFDDHGLVLSSRVDWSTCRAAPSDVVDTLVMRAGACGAQSVFVTQAQAPDPDPATLSELSMLFVVAGMEVLWTGRTADGVWRGLHCAASCPDHPLDSHSPAVVELIAQGWSAAPDRASVVAEVDAEDPVPDLCEPMPPGPALERWRDETIRRGMDLLTSARPVTTAEVQLIAAACRDIRVRDVILWRLERTDAGRAVDRNRRWLVFATALRRAPSNCVAPVAAVAALTAWQQGEGTRATACLARARDADPQHSLAALVRRCVDQAVPPATWRQCMASLDEVTCRHGTSADNSSPDDRRQPSE